MREFKYRTLMKREVTKRYTQTENGNKEFNNKQEAQSHCDNFRQWGAKKIDRRYTKSVSEGNRILTKQFQRRFSQKNSNR